MSERTCTTCVWSDLTIVDTTCDDTGDLEPQVHRVCRRFPPVMVAFQDAAAATWPLVHDEEWCGEWRRNDVDNEGET